MNGSIYGSIYKETLRQTWIQVLLWGLGFGAMGMMTIAFIPNADGLAAMVNVIENLPEFLVRAVGGTDDFAFMSTPEGFIAVGFFGKALLFFAAYPIVVGLRVTVNEEYNGTMDTLMSLPVPRWQVIVEKFAAYLTTLLGVVVLFIVGLYAGDAVFNTGLNMARMTEASVAILPPMVLILAVTTLVGAVISERRNAIFAVLGFVLGSFMLDTMGATAAGTFLDDLRVLSFFSYYDSTAIIQNGMMWGNIALLISLSVLALAGALWAFERRDIRT